MYYVVCYMLLYAPCGILYAVDVGVAASIVASVVFVVVGGGLDVVLFVSWLVLFC